jgi:hypothetical protein
VTAAGAALDSIIPTKSASLELFLLCLYVQGSALAPFGRMSASPARVYCGTFLVGASLRYEDEQEV